MFLTDIYNSTTEECLESNQTLEVLFTINIYTLIGDAGPKTFCSTPNIGRADFYAVKSTG